MEAPNYKDPDGGFFHFSNTTTRLLPGAWNYLLISFQFSKILQNNFSEIFTARIITKNGVMDYPFKIHVHKFKEELSEEDRAMYQQIREEYDRKKT